MNQGAASLTKRWEEIVRRLRTEVANLNPEERRWIELRLEAIALLQEELHAIVLQGGGDRLCAACREHCCGDGKNHFGLPNLLFYLLHGGVPEADFSSPCPQLGPKGCHIPPARRPFNCITFNCEKIEERLGAAETRRLHGLETALRALYESFAQRFAGAGPHGLLIRAERLGSGSFLARIDLHNDKERKK